MQSGSNYSVRVCVVFESDRFALGLFGSIPIWFYIMSFYFGYNIILAKLLLFRFESIQVTSFGFSSGMGWVNWFRSILPNLDTLTP